jgi:hypothetical protein
VKQATFQAYLSKLQIKNRSNSSGSSQDIQIVLDDITISDHDLTQLKNITPDSKVSVMIKPTNEQLSLNDIEETRKNNREENYKIL